MPVVRKYGYAMTLVGCAKPGSAGLGSTFIRNAAGNSFFMRAIAAGANEMSGIEFVVSEQSKLLDRARDDAIADARRKAELYAKAAGADFVKTGTGFGPRPASVRDVRVIRETVGQCVKIKAAGGIRSREQAEELLSAGADRIGASASVQFFTHGGIANNG